MTPTKAHQYPRLNRVLVENLTHQLPQLTLLCDPDSLDRYSSDETEDLHFQPEAVAIPENVEQISQLMAWCTLHGIPVTPRGAGTGLSGGSLPVYGGVLLSLERLNRILSIDERNLQATVESGVITQVLMDAVEKLGYYYPVDPSSKGSSYLGGNVAHGSGGPRVVKYGTIRQYVLNLEVVLPSGEVLWTGANTIKFASGYDLTQLLIGSEGTLAIITKIVLQLIPKPGHTILLMAGFSDLVQGCRAVSELFKNGFTPSAVEFMERIGIEWVTRYDHLTFDLPPQLEAYLMIELDGNSPDELMVQAEKIAEVLYDLGCKEVQVAETASQKEQWWRIRRKMAESIKSNSIYKEEDTVVPRAELARLLTGIKSIGARYGFRSICYGHAGDGNLHVNILKEEMEERQWTEVLPEAIREIFTLTVSLGGTLSGEHGIGYVQKGFMDIKFSAVHLALLKGIKAVFDPLNILNPGKIWN